MYGDGAGEDILQTFVANMGKGHLGKGRSETSKKPNYREKFSLIGDLGTVKEAK